MRRSPSCSQLSSVLETLKSKAESLEIHYAIDFVPDLSLKNPGDCQNGMIRIWDQLNESRRVEVAITVAAGYRQSV